MGAFRALEHDPVDDENDLVGGAILEEYGAQELLRGLTMVAATLRDALIGHAKRLGCECGSDEWLKRMQYENVSKADE